MTYNSDKYHPWDDEGDQVILQKIVPHDTVGHPFEAYFYLPRPGYGHIKFNKDNIQLRYPKAQKDVGLYLWDFDMDGDADFDADDVGCLIGLLATFGLGYLIKKTSDKSRQDEFGIIWPLELNYDQIFRIEVKGRTLEITSKDRKKRKLTLRVALEDGERLYRELSFHYPKALYT